MSERIEKIKEHLASTRHYLSQVFDQVGDRWETPLYHDGAQWTIRQLAIHLSLADKGMGRQIMGIAEGGEGAPADFDLERYNKTSVEKRADKTIEEVRQDLAANRAELLAWLDSVKDESVLEKIGRHGSLAMLSIAQFLQLIADHEATHAKDIAQVLNIEA